MIFPELLSALFPKPQSVILIEASRMVLGGGNGKWEDHIRARNTEGETLNTDTSAQPEKLPEGGLEPIVPSQSSESTLALL